MKALIDSDIFQYEFGSAVDEEGRPLPWPFVQARIQARIEGILEATGADSYALFITSDDKSNFRFKTATIKPYKGNRLSEKPYYYYHIRNFLIDNRDAVEVFHREADDAISETQYLAYEEIWEDGILADVLEVIREKTPDQIAFDWFKKHDKATIICSRDKDLDMVPGLHYSWGAGKQKEKQLWWQNELDGLRSFYRQILLGDSVDNIPGLYGVGKSSKLIDRLSGCVSELECYEHVLSEYTKRFGSYADQFLTENAKLLWMLQYEGQVWEAPSNKESKTSTEKERT
jgi:hypothetical protein